MKTDFCVVGGGPGGLALALMLARSGAEVVVAERSRSLDREYRGDILQPGGLAVLDELGVLAGARARGAYQMDGFALVERDRTLLDIDYRELPGRHNYLLSIPQRHVLEELLAQCQALPNLTYLAGHRATGLRRSGSAVTGVTVESGAGPQDVEARCVIGADGRYSKIRSLAGIRYEKSRSLAFVVLWARLPLSNQENTGKYVTIHRMGGDPVVVHPSWPTSVQLGWTLLRSQYTQLRGRDFAEVRDLVAEAVPQYRTLIRARIAGFNQLRLLDAFSGLADEWVRDGLVLIGDAAHTHSPLGAQGINLALQDAAALHPILIESLSRGTTADHLRGYEARRRTAIEAVLKVQAIQAKTMLARGGPAAWLRPKIAKVLGRTPLGGRMTRLIAFGPTDVPVRTDLFTAATPTPSERTAL